MCKACKMDPSEVDTFYRRQGMVDVEDFDEEPRYHKPGVKSPWHRNKKKPRTKRGCSANGGKAHVWVWTSEYEITDIFYKHFGFHKKETKVCCGCGHKSKTRETEEYLRRKEKAWRKITGGAEFGVPRGAPVSRYGRWGRSFWSFAWEMEDPEYKAKYDEWYERQCERWLAGYATYLRY